MSIAKEVERFKLWASTVPAHRRSAEWECDYPNWNELKRTIFDFMETGYSQWSKKDIDDIMYAIARDNECNLLIEKLSADKPLLLFLATKAINSEEKDAKWQFAEALGELPVDYKNNAEELLLIFVNDQDEYVSRRALIALGRIKSSHAGALAERAWNSGLEYQKIAALWVFKEISFPRLAHFLDMAAQDESTHVTKNADEIRHSLFSKV